MKIIAIGDTHGSNFWKTVVRSNSFDKFIFIGDYFDSIESSPESEMNNFWEIVAFKQANPGQVVLLIGNHDFHYTPMALAHKERYSSFNAAYSVKISQLLQSHMSLLQPSYKHDDFLFTHAGVSNTWLQDFGYDGLERVDVFINQLFSTNPRAFFFRGSNPYGDDVTQSPIWIRPASLVLDGYSAKQVVGHTKVQQIKSADGNFYFIDTLMYARECLCIEDGVISILKDVRK